MRYLTLALALALTVSTPALACDAQTVVHDILKDATKIEVQQEKGTVAVVYREELYGYEIFFLANVGLLVPALFEKCPQTSHVWVRMEAEMVNKRGQTSVLQVAVLQFSRENAATINWKNVQTGNIKELADSFWSHPGLEKEPR